MSSASLTLITDSDISAYDNGNFTAIRGMAASNDGGKLYVAINGNGLLKSTNGGTVWNFITNTNGTSVACSANGTIVYLAHLGVGLYKSTNSGSTWSYVFGGPGNQQPLPGGATNPEVNAGYTSDNVYQVTCDATGNILMMTTNFAAVFYRSSDGGVTWSDMYTTPNYISNPQTPLLVSSNANGSIYYAAFNNTDQQIYKSYDSGSSWAVISTLDGVPGPFAGLATNLAGDFVFATDTNGDLNIFYETHADKSALPAFNGSLVTTVASYENGNNVMVMINNAVQTYLVNNLYPPGPIPGPQAITCFKEGTKLLCFKDQIEQYVNIETLRKGDLLKTARNGYVAIQAIGCKEIYHPATPYRVKNQLYVCSPDEYPSLLQDLVITGCHSLLVRDFADEEQREKTIDVNGDTYVTDKHYRLPVCADDRANVYPFPGLYTVYHIALMNTDYYMNYGIYANGVLLVETCSQRYLKELSGMTLLLD